MKPWYKKLYVQVLIAIALGVVLGYFNPALGEKMKPLGDGFIRLITMMIAPIIFCTIVTGITGAGSLKQAGRVGIKALIYFEVVTTLALIIGLLVINHWQPGAGMGIDVATLDTSALQAKMGDGKPQTGAEFILHLIPSTLIGAFTGGDLLQVVLVSLLFAAALVGAGEPAKPILTLIERFSHVLFGMIGLIMKLAPIGAFGAMAFTIGKYGVATLGSLAQLMLAFYTTCILFIVIVLGGLLWLFCRISILRLLAYIKEELLVVLGTSSSESVLPRMIDKLTHLGCGRQVVGITIPTGYSFNLDGTSIYLTMAAIFVAQATGTALTLPQELALLGTLLLTSKGAAGVTGSGFVVLAATLSATGSIPVAGLALILGIDRFMSEARALTNLIGNAAATLVIAQWEKAFDAARAKNILLKKQDPGLETAA